MSRDTSEFACARPEAWWQNYGQKNYPNATSILLLADGGGSNSSRSYLFKEDLQNARNRLSLVRRVAHYPPYTSKFHPIERKLFCHVARAFSRVVLTSIQVAKTVIEEKVATYTELKVFASISEKTYAIGWKACARCIQEVTTLALSSLET